MRDKFTGYVRFSLTNFGLWCFTDLLSYLLLIDLDNSLMCYYIVKKKKDIAVKSFRLLFCTHLSC